MSFGMVSGVSRGMDILDGGTHPLRGRGGIGGRFVHWFKWCFRVHFCIRLVCEKFTIFPFGQYIVGNFCLLAFWRYSQFRDRSCAFIADGIEIRQVCV